MAKSASREQDPLLPVHCKESSNHVPLPPKPPLQNTLPQLTGYISMFSQILRILSKPSGRSWTRGIIPLVLLLVVISALVEAGVFFVGILPAQLYKVLLSTENQVSRFCDLLWQALLLMLVLAFFKALAHFTSSLISIRARCLLTQRLQQNYLSSFHYYHSNSIPDKTPAVMDNPDQRIAQDAERFCTILQELFERGILAPPLILFYTVQTWLHTGWSGPALIYSYFLLSTLVCRFLMQPLVPFVFRLEQLEGFFRYVHLRLRYYAEAIALSRCEIVEGQLLSGALDRLIECQLRLARSELWLTISTQFISDFGGIVSYIAIAIPLFSHHLYQQHEISPGDLASLISTNSFFSMYLVNKLTRLTELSQFLAESMSYMQRFMPLLRTSFSNDLAHNLIQTEPPESLDASVQLHVEDLRYDLPSSSLNRHLFIPDFVINNNDCRLLIVSGGNGLGKSTLVRALTGLWAIHESSTVQLSYTNQLGQIKYSLPCSFPYLSPHIVMVLSQQTYLPLTQHLSHLLTFPKMAHLCDEELNCLLDAVGLQHLLPRLESESAIADDPRNMDWHFRLSPGEQQKLSLARVIYWRPRLLILDEATNAVDRETEARCLALFVKMNIKIIWITHHQQQLPIPDNIPTNLMVFHVGHVELSKQYK